MESMREENTIVELLEWHKPEISRLSVGLDTNSSFGSGGDLEDMTTVPI